MRETTELILIECSQETADELRIAIEALPDMQYQVSQRKNLDGSDATWIVIAALSLQALPHVLTFIGSQRPKLPSKIKVGDIEIENPTQEDLERLRKLYAQFGKTGE